MTTMQTEFTESELLQSHPVAEPLVAGGVRCHGGFDDDGAYVSPRTLHRAPAIQAWQEQRLEQFGTPLVDLALDTWPEHYPNAAQARCLLEEGVRQPLVATLTRIGTVEGFGSMLRYSTVPDMQACFEEDVRGTALAHLDRGLYEAHARDEAGFEDEGGHKQMWFAARDIAFDNPVTEDETQTMLHRMGITSAPGAPVDLADLRRKAEATRVLPADIDFDLESVVARMASLLLIEISAFHTFAWAEEVLADDDLVAGDGEAARLVSYIRADETPHVEYLKTVLSEMRDRTWIGSSGRRHPGTAMVGAVWEVAVANSLGARRDQLIRQTVAEVEHALVGHPRRHDVLDRFHDLGTEPAPTGSPASAPAGPVTY